MSTRGPSHRQITIAVILGLVFGAAPIARLDSAERRAVSEPAGVQASVVTLSALTDLVSAIHALDGDVQAAVSSFAGGHEDIVSVRVVDLRGHRLLASTEAADLADGPLPRPFQGRSGAYRAWTLLGDRLGAAVESNRRQGRLVMEEISVRRLEDGPLKDAHLALAAPVEYGRNLLGVVLMEARGSPVDLGGRLGAVLAVLAAVALAAMVGGRLQGRGWLSAVVAGALVAVTLGLVSWLVLDGLMTARRTAEERVAARLLDDYERTQGLGSASAAVNPDRWDANRFRRPRGIVSGDGSVDTAALETSAPDLRDRLRGRFLLFSALGSAVSLVVGLGSLAARRGDPR